MNLKFENENLNRLIHSQDPAHVIREGIDNKNKKLWKSITTQMEKAF